MSKKIKYVGIFILVLLFLGLCRGYYKKKSIENDIKLYLNTGKETKYIGKNSIYDTIEKLKNPEIEKYEISTLVGHYIDLIEECIRAKQDNDRVNDEKIARKDEGLSLWIDLDKYIEVLQKKITDEDIKIYNKKNFKDIIIKELEKVLIHDVENNENKWYIKNDGNKIIELPYNFYINYETDGTVKNGDSIIIQNVNITSIRKKNNRLLYDVTYIVDGVEKKKEDLVIVIEKDKSSNKQIYFLPSIWKLYYTYTKFRPKVSFGQHDYDEERDRHWSEIDDLMGDTPD